MNQSKLSELFAQVSARKPLKAETVLDSPKAVAWLAGDARRHG